MSALTDPSVVMSKLSVLGCSWPDVSSVLAYPMTLSNSSLTSRGQCQPRLTTQL